MKTLVSVRRCAARLVFGLIASVLVCAAPAGASLTGLILGPSGSPVPTNWTLLTLANPSASNLINEAGVQTGINVAVTGASTSFNAFSVNPTTVPRHSPSLSVIDSNFESRGTIQILFSHLQPDELFNVFVFGFDAQPGAQQFPPYQNVTITGTTSATFTQFAPGGPPTPAAFYVNVDPDNGSAQGSNAKDLEHYAIPIFADNSGDITIQVTTALPGVVTTRLAGAALEPVVVPESPLLPAGALATCAGGLLVYGARRGRLC